MNLVRTAAYVLVFALGVVTTACSGTTSDGPNVSDPAEEEASEDDELRAIVYTERNDGQTVSVVEGQSVTVALASNRTTGYRWNVVSTDRTFGYPKVRYVSSSNGATGSGGTDRLTWATKGGLSMVGKHTVKLDYRRPGDDVSKATKSFSLTIDIKPVSTSKAVAVAESDNGKTVKANVGEDVVLTLASNPTTGYRWRVTTTDRTFGYPTEQLIAATSGAVGAGGQQKFTWKTDGPLDLVGKHTVSLEYQRPWSETSPAEKTFTFTVDVAR